MKILKDLYCRNWKLVAIVAVYFALWMLVDGCFMGKMHDFAENNMTHWSMVWFAIIIIVIFLIWSCVLVVRHAKYDYLPSSEGKAIVLLLCLLYGYYRFVDEHFCFWGIGSFAWLDLSFVLLAEYVLWEIWGVARSLKRTENFADKEKILLRDDAIETEDEDRLWYNDIVNNLVLQIESVDLSKYAYSVGIAGEWGIGKSSLLNLFAEKQKEMGNIVICFHPRSAKTINQIGEDFFATFANAMRKYDGSYDTLISRYAHTLQLDGELKWLNSIIGLFSTWTSENRKRKVNDALRKLGRRVFVIVEDLDRLTGPEIMEVLKIIDTNGNFCNTVFMSAYDKVYVNAALNKEIGYGDKNIYFTDKYFQFEYPMKRQAHEGVWTFVQEYVYNWALEQQTTKVQRSAIEEDWGMTYRMLYRCLPTMRAWKRYANLLRCSYVKIKENVNFADFALVTLIRYLDNEAYIDLYRKKYITNTGNIFADTEQNVLIKDVEKIAATYTLVPGLYEMLQFMFSENMVRSKSIYGRIQREESFYNYFVDQTAGKLYYATLEMLMNMPNLAKAVSKIENYSSESDKNQQSIEEYLFTRLPQDIMTMDRLRRYVALLICGYAIYNKFEYSRQLNHLLTPNAYQEYSELRIVDDQENYIRLIVKGMTDMYEHCPEIVTHMMIQRINERRRNEHFDEICIEPLEQDVSVAEGGQLKYDALCGTDEWSARDSIMIAQISILPNNSLTRNASHQIQTMMWLHREEYARQLIFIESPDYSQNYSNVVMWSYNVVRSTIGGVDDFSEWINGIKDKNVKYIVKMLHETAKQTNNARIHTAYIEKERWTDYAYIADMVKQGK